MSISDDTRKKLKSRLKPNEHYERFPYRDTNGYLTIGYGRNLDTVGLSEVEANFCLENDIDFHVDQLQNNFVFFDHLTEARKSVLIEMSYNLGFKNLCTFEKMLRAIALQNYHLAADEMLDSVWHKQVHGRAEMLADIMRAGNEPIGDSK